jgi:glycosidase
MILTALAAAVIAAQTHEFVFTSDRDLDTVNVAGTFNGWSSTAHGLSKGESGRRWSTTLDIEPGRHQYKFVLNGDEWIVDPNASLNEDDGNGNTNSILLIVPPDYDAPALRGDGLITSSAVSHDTSLSSSSWHSGLLTLNVKVRAGDVTRVVVQAGGKSIPAERGLSDELYETHSAKVPWDRASDLSYVFLIQDGDQSWSVGEQGVTAAKSDPFVIDAESFRPFLTPDWSEGAVFYQIFPDRFANGSLDNDPEDLFDWDQDPTYYGFHGGDLAGIRSHTDYLKSLGIDAVYMTPVFESPSNHRYETVSYFKIDHRLGANDEFSALTRHLKKAGIRTVLDGVFNHTGTEFFAFEDVRAEGADSRFADWYTVHDYPVRIDAKPNYEAFYGFPSMPKLNTLNPHVQSHIFEAMTFWNQNAEIAGWRLDVANEVSMPFWRRYRRHMKSLGEDQLIIGEHWGDGTPWLKGDQWDSMMGYQFREAALQWIARGNGSPSKYLETLIGIYLSYPPQVSGNLMNLLGSHDTPRFLSMADGDQDLLKLGQTMLLTWPGAPCIYYGDELGMAGGADPDNRRGMRWDLAEQANDVLAHVRRLIAMRQASPALMKGEPTVQFTDDERQIGAFSRTYDGETALVAVSRSSHPETVVIPLSKGLRRWASSTPLRDGLTGYPIALTAHGELRVELPPKGSAVVLPEDLVLALSN